jgi:tripartite-type tricarboxylate transporter receptor subunit TctC
MYALRHVFCLIAAIGIDGGIAGRSAFAQTYPTKPVRMLLGLAPGGGTDFTARVVANKLSEKLGQPVIVENRPGANTAIATERVAKSAPDGYTIQMLSSAGAIVPAMRSDLPYNLLRDLAPVSLVATGAYVLTVHPSVPVQNVKQLVALARAQPNRLNSASAGLGSATHIVAALFCQMANIKVVHVPYKSGSQSATAVVAGEADMSFSSVAGALAFLSSRRLRALAVSTADRVALAQTIPTMQEAGFPGFDRAGWYGVIAPAGVPKNIIAELNAAIHKLAPEIRETVNKEGFEPHASSPAQFHALIARELAQNEKVVKALGLHEQRN